MKKFIWITFGLILFLIWHTFALKSFYYDENAGEDGNGWYIPSYFIRQEILSMYFAFPTK